MRNRHEAYGIVSEHLTKIISAVKSIKDSTGSLLTTLAEPNMNAVDATSSIVNSTVATTYVLLVAAAEMRRTLNDLYTAENIGLDEPSPMEKLLEGEFQEVEPADAGEDEEETEE